MADERARGKRTAVFWVAIGMLPVAYVLTYLALSWRGAYEPAAIGIDAVKWYEWAPAGFIVREWPGSIRPRPLLFVVFLPLHRLDCAYWHTAAKSHRDLYPVHDLTYVQP